MNDLKISVVIPVYNEQRLLPGCLKALTRQTHSPFEIIVVDNNSSDDSVKIAKKFGAKVVHEPNQGITYARTSGFNRAAGDIIARIDADTVVSRNWIARIQHDFANPNVDAVSGIYGIQELSPTGRFWFRWPHYLFRWWHQNKIGVKPMLYGYNTALRRNLWQKMAKEVNLGDKKISEDVEVAILAHKYGKVKFDPKLIVNCYYRRFLQFKKLAAYLKSDKTTIALHKKLGNLS